MRPSDESLIQEALLHREAFTELVLRYQDKIYNLVYRMTGDAEESKDLVQETFVRAFTALRTFQQDARFSPWLYRIAVNQCINYQKRRREHALLSEDIVPDTNSRGPEATAEQNETQERVQKAVLSLPQEYRAVILLRHMSELSYQEIADTLQMPLGTVKVRLFRAREMLHERLVEEGMSE